MSGDDKVFAGWAILELMGRRRLGGIVEETEIAGQAFLRIDVPDVDSDDPDKRTATQFYSAAAIYCITPCEEEVARAIAVHSRPEPVQRWELPSASEEDSADPGEPTMAYIDIDKESSY